MNFEPSACVNESGDTCSSPRGSGCSENLDSLCVCKYCALVQQMGVCDCEKKCGKNKIQANGWGGGEGVGRRRGGGGGGGGEGRGEGGGGGEGRRSPFFLGGAWWSECLNGTEKGLRVRDQNGGRRHLNQMEHLDRSPGGKDCAGSIRVRKMVNSGGLGP